jgi:hypothetical protein
MKNSISILLLSAAIAGNIPASRAGETVYIPWAFDDFDSNCQVVENITESYAVAVSSMLVETIADEEQGELGW